MTGTIQIREGVAGDRDAILALRELAFPASDAAMAGPDFWRWKFQQGYTGEARVFVAEAGDQIVGHFAFVPQRYEARGPVLAAMGGDVMTHPDFRRQGIFSSLARFAADRLRRDFRILTAWAIRKPSLLGLLAQGWHPSLRAPVLVKPLSLRNLGRELAGGSRARPDSPGAGPVNASVRPLAPADSEEVDALLATEGIRQRRSPDFLRWRYRENPSWSYQIDGFYDGKQLKAFVVHRDATLRGIRSLAVADAGAAAGSGDSLRRLLRHVCASGRARGLGMASALMTRHHPIYFDLLRSGFIPGPHRFRLLLLVFDEGDQWMKRAPWSLSWGDTDHL